MPRFCITGTRRQIAAFSLFLSCQVVAASALQADDTSSEPAATDLLRLVMTTSDALIEHGQDRWGDKKTAFIASVLDRRRLAPPEELPPGAAGARFGDRTTPYGSNVNMQQNLLRTFFLLSDVTGDAAYREAANGVLTDFITLAQSPVTDLMAWGEHLSYDMLADEAKATGDQYLIHEPKKPLIFWNTLYRNHPEQLLRYSKGIWEHQIYDKQTGQFSRHARFDIHRPSSKGMDFTKEAGHFVDIWSHAFEETSGPLHANAVQTLVERYAGRLNERSLLDYDSERRDYCNNGHNLTFLCDVWDAAERMRSFDNGSLSRRMETLARRMDSGYLAVSHRPDIPDAGFVATCTTGNGQPRDRSGPGVGGYSVLWGMGYGRQGTAMIAMHAFRRAQQLVSVHSTDAESYQSLAIQAADTYAATGKPDAQTDIWPVEYGTVILMHLEAYRLTGDSQQLRQARRRAEESVKVFWDDTSVLPKSSRLTDHYETITGIETLIYALFSVHAVENKLAIELPLSDIDR